MFRFFEKVERQKEKNRKKKKKKRRRERGGRQPLLLRSAGAKGFSKRERKTSGDSVCSLLVHTGLVATGGRLRLRFRLRKKKTKKQAEQQRRDPSQGRRKRYRILSRQPNRP